jgi:UDPglucose 6-dehydrogenase
MNLSIIGTGYVGLVTGTCLAEIGHQVVCIDNNQEKLEILKQNKSPIYELGLEDLIKQNTELGRLSFSDNLKEAVINSDAIFLCLPTPANHDGTANLSFLFDVAGSIGKILQTLPADGKTRVIINKSTAPVGISRMLTEKIRANSPVDISDRFEVVSNPEFLRQGTAVWDCLNPERIVIGANSEFSKNLMLDLYKPFESKNTPILVMDTASSELTKYAANSFLALKISFANELSNLCEKLGANIDLVTHGIATDSRISPKFLNPGIGFGGSCFPKDVSAIHSIGIENDYSFQILEAVMQVNRDQRLHFVHKIKKLFGTDLSGKTFGVWGLAFKPGTDDVRDAPSIDIIGEMILLGAKIKAYGPEATANWKKFTNLDIETPADHYEVAKDVDALLILTEWDIFKASDLSKVKSLMKNPVILDGRNTFSLEEVSKADIYYESMGRQILKPRANNSQSILI